MKNHMLGALALVTTLYASISQTALADVQYQIKISNPAQHLAEVRIDFPAVHSKTLDVQMPIWRTGRYEVLNLGKNVRQMSATNGQGKALVMSKTDKGTWRVQTQKGDTVTIKYEIYANALGERTQHIDDTHAYLDASGVLMYAAPFRHQALQVQLETPAAWVSRSGLEKGTCEHCFVAPNYDVLIDSPIETGLHEFHQFEIDGRTIALAIWGRGNYDGNKMNDDLKKIVAESKKLLGEFPFKKRYLFIVHATDGVGGATEHLNSTVIQHSRWNYAPHKEYLGFLRTAAHEFIHTWNVKAYRPKEMVPYDYQHENYSRLLWMAEGNTSYYEDLVSLRAGLMNKDEYMDELAKLIHAYQHQPGRFQQSAAESSFNAWIDAGGERAKNASVNIYSKGHLLGMVMDILIRQQTQNEKGFEDVHRYLYQHHTVDQGGYSEEQVRAALKTVTGKDWADWWTQYVDGVAELPLIDLLKSAGLNYAIEAGKDEEQKENWFTGWNTKDGGDFPVISDVERDSPAWQAGVVAGDTLIAANGIRLNNKSSADRLWLIQTLPIKLTVFRRDELKELNLNPIRQANGKAKIKAQESADETQKLRYEKWLGIAWSTKPNTTANTEKNLENTDKK